MSLAEFKQAVRDKYPEAFALHREGLDLLEPAIQQPRQHAGLLELAVDMLFVQAYKAHVSVLLLVLHGHMEDAATIARRLLELAAAAGHFALAPTSETKTARVKRYLADMWVDLPPEAQDLLPDAAKKFWRNITEQAGLTDYRLHDNRHTHASHLVSSGLSLEIVGRLLGHTNPLTTKRYAHLADDPLRAAAERFGSKMEALREDRQANIVPIPSRRSQT